MPCADLEGWGRAWGKREAQERGDTCTHTAGSHCHTTKTNTTLPSNYRPIFKNPMINHNGKEY